jgi:hypothetical protein
MPLHPPGGVAGQTVQHPDSDLHGLNVRMDALESLVADLETRLNAHNGRIQQIAANAVQFDPSGDVSLKGHLNVQKDINVLGDVKLLT